MRLHPRFSWGRYRVLKPDDGKLVLRGLSGRKAARLPGSNPGVLPRFVSRSRNGVLGSQSGSEPIVASLDRKRLGADFGVERGSRSDAFSIKRLGGNPPSRAQAAEG